MPSKKRKRTRRRGRSGDPDVEMEYGSDPEIPTILDADELIDKAFRRASKVVVPDSKPFYQARKTASAKMDSVAGTIGATLERYIASFPDFNTLHPFHKDLYTTLFDIGKAQKSLSALQWCKGQVASIASKTASQINRTKSKEFVSMKVKEAYGRINSVVQQVKKDLLFLAEVKEALDKVHRIDVRTPTAVVAGSPNVGKSLLVTKMSSGKPEVAPYPFTTKAVTVGHFFHRRVRLQVLDTPGILDRPLAERNKIELQAVLALRHLAQATVFIFDPTEECGASLEAQRRLLDEVRDKFAPSGSKVFIVWNKVDIRDRWKEGAPDGAFEISAKDGAGVEGLMAEVAAYLFKRVMESDRLF
jgi:nucleolar GTP-binding protein